MKKRSLNINGRVYKVPRYVNRIDSEFTHGWQVRVDRYNGYLSKLFSDGIYGGIKKSLDAATEFLKSIEKSHDLHKGVISRVSRERRPSLTFYQRNDHIYCSWQVCLTGRYNNTIRAQTFRRVIGNLDNFSLEKAKSSYQKVYAVNAYHKEQSREKGYHFLLDFKKLRLDELINQYPCSTRFLTKKYILEEWRKRNDK